MPCPFACDGSGRLVGKEPLECSADALELAFLCTGCFTDGVGFRVTGGTEIYFGTNDGEELLAALKRRGAPVTTEARRIRLTF